MPKLKQFPNESFTMCEGQHEYKFFNDIANPSYIKNRVDRIFNKEPETIQWIQSIPQDAVFFDIGANIGIYTIYAAVNRNCKTFSFEPHSANYKTLIENINLNKLKNSKAYPLAIGKTLELSSMFVKNLYAGVADNIVDGIGEIYHGVVIMSIDDLINSQKLPQPDYIKIDVDGYEDRVFEGCKETLKKCKGLLIEIDQKHEKIIKNIENLGFEIKSEHKRNEAEKNYIFKAV